MSARPNRSSTRRFFLAGVGASFVGGLAAVRTQRGRRLLHRVFDEDRLPPAAGIAVEAGVTTSGRRYAWASTGAPRAVLLCLHGRGENERFAFDTLRLPDFARELGFDCTVLAVDGGSHSYWHARRGVSDPLEEIIAELLPRFAGQPVFVLGWSMGGYGALLAAIEHPGVFAGVIATSAALYSNAKTSAQGAFDDEADFAAHDVWKGLARLQLPLRLDCGEDDRFADANRRLLAQLPHAEGGISAGFHDISFWRRVVPEHVRFIARVASRLRP